MKQQLRKPSVVACHAGLECGILGTNYPDMDMISFGPTIRGAIHLMKELKYFIIAKFWKFFAEILEIFQ
jgi:dipeptidase D